MLKEQRNQQFYVLDTETTGLDNNAQIVELGLINQDGEKIIDTLVKPTIQIPQEATNIHGITTEQAMDEGIEWSQVNGMLFELLINPIVRKDLIIYNANYDVRLIEQTCFIHDENSLFDLEMAPHVSCAMLAYAEYWGEQSWSGDYKWQSLVKACAQQNVKVENAHRAVADCQMTLNLLKAVWAK